MTSPQATPPLLSRAECSALRGLAIIAIVMHNYSHWLRHIVQENEYQYFQHNVDWLSRVLVHPDGLLPVHILSFFGHYGVPVFLFLSAYGLEQKYAVKEAGRPYDFVRTHFLKLFKMMIVGFVAFILVDQITPGAHHYAFMDVVAQLGMFNNLLPSPDKIIWPGPYWFFCLMLQLYIFYRFVIYRRPWTWTVGAIMVCWLLQVFCDSGGETLNRLRYNMIGGMLPFGLGVLYSRYGRALSNRAYDMMMVVSALCIVFFSYNYQLWYFVPVFICSFSIGLVKSLGRFPLIFNHFVWVGSISAALFICHPLTRKILIPISRQGDIYTGLLLYVVASICMAWLFRELLKRIPNP